MHHSQLAADSDRAAINRKNAVHSTGPLTPEGKHRVGLNALRHGLTGQTVVLPEDDLAAYQKPCAQEQPASEPTIHRAPAQAKALDGRGDLLARLSLYEQRLNRTLALAKAELKQLQQDRAQC